MHNDFVLIGPTSDPARVRTAKNAAGALGKVSVSKAPFISRGDDSGTHKLELTLWEQAGVTPTGGWYSQSGQGMGQTIQIAGERQAYTVADRGTSSDRGVAETWSAGTVPAVRPGAVW